MPLLGPRSWAGFVPNGIGQVKPNHYGDMLKVLWRNRDELPFAWRILRDGACDGCALGTSGLRDWTLDGVHLCMVRLNLLRMNTMAAMDEALLGDVAKLPASDNRALRELGRLPYPMLRRDGETGFHRVGWDEALDLAAAAIRASDPHRFAFYVTSRGITNEVYYVAQKVARALGTNHVDNAARICHAPSTVALKQSLGVAASTCSYSDWMGTDLIVFFGSDVPNNQPVTTKYLYFAKQAGTKIAVVNPLREPGLERYWVPSVLESAVFGTKLADDFFAVHTGGDRAFITGVLKALGELGAFDEAFLAAHVEGFDAVRAQADAADWASLERGSGASRESMQRFAQLYANAKTAIFVWSMGITQHAEGVDNVQAIVNLALARGMVGRAKTGLMPIRGHSGVQGGAEVGAVPNHLPGYVPVDAAGARHFESLWGFPVPEWHRLDGGRDGGPLRRRRRRPALVHRRQLRRDAAGSGARARVAGARTAAGAPRPRGVADDARRSRSRRRRAAAARDDALRAAGRRHRDDHGTPHRVLARDSRPPHRRSAQRVAGVARSARARRSRARRDRGLRGCGRDPRRDRARRARLRGDRDAAREGRPGAVGRPATLRTRRRPAFRNVQRSRARRGDPARHVALRHARPRRCPTTVSASARAAASSSTR